MAETSLYDQDRATEAEPTPTSGPTPMSQFAGRVTASDAMIPEYKAAGSEVVSGLRASAARKGREAADVETVMGQQDTTAAASRATVERAREKAAAQTPLDTQPRPFLSPGPGLLSQLQAAMTGVTQMVLGVGGLKGGGNAIAAVAGLKGALEGWQAGDHERAQSAYRDWKAAAAKLHEDLQTRMEQHRDLLTDQKTSMDNRLALIGMRAAADGDTVAADLAHQGNIKGLIDLNMKREAELLAFVTRNRQFDLEMEKLQKQIAQSNRDYALRVKQDEALQRQRGISNARAAEASSRAADYATFRKETSVSLGKLQTQDISLGNKLRTADLVEEAVTILKDNKMLAGGPTTPDAWRAAARRNTAFGDPKVKWAIDTIERQGTALVVGSEIALGEPASAMRLKAVVEPQAGHILTAGPDFWKSFFDRYRPFLQEQRTMVRDHLQQIGRLPPEPVEQGWTAVPVE